MISCSNCGQTLARRDRVCPVCGVPRPEKSARFLPSRRAFAVAAAGGAFGLLALAYRLRSPRPSPTAAPRASAPDGPPRVVLQAESIVVPIAVDETAAAELKSVPTAKFGFGYPRLIREGKVFDVPAGTTALSLERRNSHVKVRVRVEATGGEREGWVAAEFVREPLEEWSPTLRERPGPIR